MQFSEKFIVLFLPNDGVGWRFLSDGVSLAELLNLIFRRTDLSNPFIKTNTTIDRRKRK